MKYFEIQEKRAQELIDECVGDPMDLALMAINALDAHVCAALILAKLVTDHPELKVETEEITALVNRANRTKVMAGVA